MGTYSLNLPAYGLVKLEIKKPYTLSAGQQFEVRLHTTAEDASISFVNTDPTYTNTLTLLNKTGSDTKLDVQVRGV